MGLKITAITINMGQWVQYMIVKLCARGARRCFVRFRL